MNTEHKYKTVMTVMNKLKNTLQARNPDCLQGLQSSTAVLAPPVKEPPTAKILKHSEAIVASRMGGGPQEVPSLASITCDPVNPVVEPPLKRVKVDNCALCRRLGEDYTTHARKNTNDCPNRHITNATVSLPRRLTQEQCAMESIRYPDEYWPDQKFPDVDFTIPPEAKKGEEWVAVMPKRKLHKASQVPNGWKHDKQ